MKKNMIFLCAVSVILGLACPSQAGIVFEDDFNDGTLDPAWSVMFEYADDWDYSESGTNLTVTDIHPTIISTAIWSRVILSRSFYPLNDFYVDFDFSWDSEGLSFYQNVYITLYDASYERQGQDWEYLCANTIAYGGYQDPWSDEDGQPVASVRGNQMPDPGPILPAKGSASITISRVDGFIKFFWDNVLLVSGFDISPLVGVDIEFWNCNSGPDILFGTESVDLVRVEGTPVSENRPPVADAGLDQTAECDGLAGTLVTLDGSNSTDPDSTPGTNDDIVSFDWYEGATLLGSGETLSHTFDNDLGEHIITLVVTDSAGETNSDEVIITVQDTIPPEIDVSVSPDTLWPPNHKMVSVSATVTATDNCDAVPDIILESITVNEGEESNTFDANYDSSTSNGNTSDDIQDADFGTADYNISLRAERSGGGNGRIYTITYGATDASGNSSTASATVTVPHHQ